MGNGDFAVPLVIGVCIGVASTLFTLGAITHNDYYKRGQIDCLNGAIYYKLEKQVDGTTDWEHSILIIK